MNKQLLKQMPACLAPGFDPHTHKTPSDLWWQARFELDLYEEGEHNDIETAANARRVKTWMTKLKETP